MDPKHATNLEYFQKERAMKQQLEQSTKRSAELLRIERNTINAIGVLLEHLRNKTSKVQVINQLQDVMSSRDAEKLVSSLDKIDKSVIANKPNNTKLETLLTQAITELKAIPKSHAEAPEPIESVKVSNLSEIDLKPLEKAVKGLKLNVEAPKVNVEAPQVTVDAPDMSYLDTLRGDLKKLLGDVVSAVGKIDLPETKLETVEKELKDQTKELKSQSKQLAELVKQPKGGGGGGGNGTPYTDSTGKPVNVEVEADGSVPVTVVAGGSAAAVYDIKNISPSTDPEIATYKYFGFLERDGTNWRIMRKTLATNVFEYATGTSGYATAWTNKDSLTYS